MVCQPLAPRAQGVRLAEERGLARPLSGGRHHSRTVFAAPATRTRPVRPADETLPRHQPSIVLPHPGGKGDRETLRLAPRHVTDRYRSGIAAKPLSLNLAPARRQTHDRRSHTPRISLRRLWPVRPATQGASHTDTSNQSAVPVRLQLARTPAPRPLQPPRPPRSNTLPARTHIRR